MEIEGCGSAPSSSTQSSLFFGDSLCLCCSRLRHRKSRKNVRECASLTWRSQALILLAWAGGVWYFHREMKARANNARSSQIPVFCAVSLRWTTLPRYCSAWLSSILQCTWHSLLCRQIQVNLGCRCVAGYGRKCTGGVQVLRDAKWSPKALGGSICVDAACHICHTPRSTVKLVRIPGMSCMTQVVPGGCFNISIRAERDHLQHSLSLRCGDMWDFVRVAGRNVGVVAFWRFCDSGLEVVYLAFLGALALLNWAAALGGFCLLLMAAVLGLAFWKWLRNNRYISDKACLQEH